jgi:tetratricopeptide (TPR) repeat protein
MKTSSPMSKEGENTPMQKVKQFIPIALLTIVCMLVYFNSLFNGFVFDDIGTIVENKYIADLTGNFPSFFSTSYFKIAGAEASYRPVATLSYFVFYAIAGLNPFWYHLGSLILHILNVILVYALVNVIQKDKTAALIAGLLFACHPVLTEAVNCISFNEDLLATLFYLLSLVLYLKIKPDAEASVTKVFFLSLLFYFLGLLSKEMAITLPAVVVIYDLTLSPSGNNQISLKLIRDTLKDKKYFYLGYTAVSLFYLSLRFVFLTGPRASATQTYGSLFERIIFLPYQIFNFLKLVFFPFPLNADYIFSYPNSFFEIQNILAVIMLIAVIGFSFYIYKKFRVVSFGIWWFLIALLPVSNLIEITNPVAERYLYLPAVGFCMALSILLVNIPNKIPLRPGNKSKIVGVFVILILALYSVIAINRNSDWKDSFSLWSQTVKRSPNSAGAHSNLGRAYLEKGLLEEAVNEFKTAITIHPEAYKAHYNLGFAYGQKGLLKKAIHEYEITIKINPNYSDAHFNLGNIYAQKGWLNDAVLAYKTVLEIDPQDTTARNNLGVIYARQGKLDNAISQWERILEIDPTNQKVKENISKAKKMLN